MVNVYSNLTDLLPKEEVHSLERINICVFLADVYNILTSLLIQESSPYISV